LLLFACIAAALAGGPWSGIPTDSVAGLGPPVFLPREAGWMAPVEAGEGGEVRVFVGRDDAEALLWLAERRSERDWTVPDWPFADEAWGNGHALMGFRDGNIAVVVSMEAGGASAVAEILHDQLEGASPWPIGPTITLDGTLAKVDGEWAYVAFRADAILDPQTMLPKEVRAVPVSSNAARLDTPPKRLDVTGWDRFGRSATATWSRE